jgi:hypothetical protein
MTVRKYGADRKGLSLRRRIAITRRNVSLGIQGKDDLDRLLALRRA